MHVDVQRQQKISLKKVSRDKSKFVAKSLKMQDSEGRKFDNVSSLAFRVLSSDAKLLLCGVPCTAQGPEQPSQQLPSVHIPGQRK
jgi:hypothetical protein